MKSNNRLWRILIGAILLAMSFPVILRSISNNWLASIINQRLFQKNLESFSSTPQVPGFFFTRADTDMQGRFLLEQGDNLLARNLLEQALLSNPSDPLLLIYAARANEALGMPEVALAQLVKAKAYTQIYERGQAEVEAGRLDKAHLYFEAAWQISPTRWQFFDSWARLFEGHADWIGAELVLEHAVQLQPGIEGIAWRSRLGDDYRHDKKWSEAETQYRAMIALSPKNDTAYLNLARSVYYGRHDFPEAYALVEAVIKHSPGSGDAYGALAELYRAEKKYGLALVNYEQQAKLEPDNYVPIDGQAQVLGAMRRWQDAIQILETAGKRFPQRIQRLVFLAQCYKEVGEIAQAIETAQLAVKLDKTNSPYYLVLLGNMYEAGGYKKDAIAAYQAALATDPSREDAQTALERLQNP